MQQDFLGAILTQLGNYPTFADPEVSLPCCQEPYTVPHPQLNQVNQRTGIQFLKNLLGIIRSPTPSYRS
jgi:hypothetical protein